MDGETRPASIRLTTVDEDPSIATFHSFRPIEFSHLLRLEIDQTDFIAGGEIALQIVLQHKTERRRKLVLSFLGVSQMNLTPSEDGVFGFSLLEIISIKDRQWEGLNYRGFESEQDSDFSFLCHSFSIIQRIDEVH
jgi:hypothetical protein